MIERQTKRAIIVAEIETERDRQDRQWGGPAHDDTHHGADWMEFIQQQVERYHADMIDNQSINIARRRLLKIATLALAGIESIDRKVSR